MDRLTQLHKTYMDKFTAALTEGLKPAAPPAPEVEDDEDEGEGETAALAEQAKAKIAEATTLLDALLKGCKD